MSRDRVDQYRFALAGVSNGMTRPRPDPPLDSHSQRTGELGFALGLIGGLGAIVFVLLDLRPELLSVIVPPGILLVVVLACHFLGRRLDPEGRRELVRNSAHALLLLGAVVATFFIALSGSAEFGLVGVLFFTSVFAGPFLLAGGAQLFFARRALGRD